MYVVINPDQTLNAIVDNLDKLCLESGFECIEYPGQRREAILDGIPLEEAVWDSELEAIVHDPEFIVGGEPWRKRKAAERIQEFYPLNKQLNLLRSGDKAAIKRMGLFIDNCRRWSNDTHISVDVIQHISP